jgi:hypothetical protein
MEAVAAQGSKNLRFLTGGMALYSLSWAGLDVCDLPEPTVMGRLMEGVDMVGVDILSMP